MSNFTKLPLIDEENETSQGEPSFRCVVEAPRGSSVKLTYDPALKAFVLRRALTKGLTYPFDWGFLPSTMGEDGDPLDVMILHDDASPMGVVIPAQIIGVLEVTQRDKGGDSTRNDRYFAVPVGSHREDDLDHVDDLSKRTRREIEEFFIAASALEDKKLEFLGWHGPKHAKSSIAEGVDRARREERRK
jgi:inorganic pyrophosphatase